MTGRIEVFDARPGGRYRLVLTYADARDAPGKADADTDVVDGVFVSLEPDVVHEVVFAGERPEFAGTMRMTWSVRPSGPDSSEITFRADDVPPGIGEADHQQGMGSSLAQLAAYLER